MANELHKVVTIYLQVFYYQIYIILTLNIIRFNY